MNTYALYSQPYLDTINQCYKNIITINMFPQGPVGSLVRRIKYNRLSEFKQAGPCSRMQNCGLAFVSLQRFCFKSGCEYMTVDELPALYSILRANGYEIDTKLTNMTNNSDIVFHSENANKLICFINYKTG